MVARKNVEVFFSIDTEYDEWSRFLIELNKRNYCYTTIVKDGHGIVSVNHTYDNNDIDRIFSLLDK